MAVAADDMAAAVAVICARRGEAAGGGRGRMTGEWNNNALQSTHSKDRKHMRPDDEQGNPSACERQTSTWWREKINQKETYCAGQEMSDRIP